MGIVLSSLQGCYGAGMTVATAAWSGVAWVGTSFLQMGGYVCAGFSLLYAIMSGCCVRSQQELIRPLSEWGDSEAKHAGWECCIPACLTSCLCIIATATVIFYFMTYTFYSL